jgi:sterol desaturase/sphingolipid hydroxylase (fatty acid hydroxylase superfamily)
MSWPSLEHAAQIALALLWRLAAQLESVLLSPSSDSSILSLVTALLVALLFMGLNRRRTRRRVRLRALMRAIFPRRLMRSPSSRMDVWYFLLNSFVVGALLGWAVASNHVIATTINGWLVAALGAREPTQLSDLATMVILTVALFLAYELGYWVDHYLSHTVPLLWEFHKVHHSAEVLSPLTNARIHPVNGLIFVNILALFMGTTEGALTWAFGGPAQQFSVANANVIIVAFTYLLAHLHHTHFWIAFTGVWGRVLISPAHHQIHHSTNPIHFNKNLGSCLAIWDWLFGTLHIPARKRERLRFGVDPDPSGRHTVTEGLIAPVAAALGHARPLIGRLGGRTDTAIDPATKASITG